MINKFIPYPETPHFKDACSILYKNQIQEIELHGTIKLHGTNFGMILDGETEQIYFQKRGGLLEEKVIEVEVDGVKELKTVYTKFFNWETVVDVESYTKFCRLISDRIIGDYYKLCFFGELVGEGVQKDVAVSELTKRFVIFDMAIVEKEEDVKNPLAWRWINGQKLKEFFNYATENMDTPPNLYCIENFKTWTIKVNVFNPVELKKLQNTIQEITLEVEKECPFAKEFGISGIGEGVVWKHNGFRFKVKGDQHTTSKVKTLGKVDEEKIAQLGTIHEFCDAICTEARLKQGLHSLMENNVEGNKIKAFIDWVIADTFKEDLEFIDKNNLDHREVKKVLGSKARNYIQLNPLF